MLAMSFKFLLGTVLFVALATALAVIVLSMFYLRLEVNALVPADVALEIQQPLQSLLIMQAAALLVLTFSLALTIYFVVGSLVARPLKGLAAAIDSYAETGVRNEIPDIDEAPAEIRSIAVSFDKLIERLDASHRHDSEITRMKSDFISTAAHQFRTPLTGIRWALEALQKEQITESQKALVDSAVGKSKDLVGIVGTLVDISAIESGKYKYAFQPTDMNALLAELTKDFSPLAVQNQVSLFFAPVENVMPFARADRERIKWVLNNLIENAITYTPLGGTVRLSIESAEHRLYIRVSDTGIGIPAEDRANIFERFYRAQNAISKQNKGNGLGLYIARTIAVDHGGDLNFASNTTGPGTTFTLSLPLA